MMNRSSSSDEAYVPSMMSFVGLEGSNLKQHHLWDWETNSHCPNTPTVPNTTNLLSHAFFAATPPPPPPPPPAFLDCPAPPPPSPPPLFPLNSYPFYSPPLQVAAEYPLGLIKREDAAAAGGGASSRIGLNLGHRTYFSSADAFAIDRLFARSRSMYSLSHHQPPRCQAEGCKADLSGAKHYHRRHKVCEFHSKATVVIAGGLQQRFCQQCSRFHVLAEFDEAKRSCRKRLADHNRRRRKPQLPAAATSETSSSKKDHSSKPSEKCKQIQRASKDSTTTKSTTTACTSTNISTSISLEGHQGYQNKGNQLRNVAALSLGGVGPVEKVGMGSASVYQGAQGPFVSVAQGKFSQRQQQQQQGNNMTFSSAASNSAFFHHHNLFSSDEASQFTGVVGGGGGGGSGHCTGQHQSGLLHLGQPMFEVDFL